jgi:hypothetical protein
LDSSHDSIQERSANSRHPQPRRSRPLNGRRRQKAPAT